MFVYLYCCVVWRECLAVDMSAPGKRKQVDLFGRPIDVPAQKRKLAAAPLAGAAAVSVAHDDALAVSTPSEAAVGNSNAAQPVQKSAPSRLPDKRKADNQAYYQTVVKPKRQKAAAERKAQLEAADNACQEHAGITAVHSLPAFVGPSAPQGGAAAKQARQAQPGNNRKCALLTIL